MLEKLNKAVKLQIGGNFSAAETIYREVLRLDADNADANHLLGLIHSERDENDLAMQLIEKAISLNASAPSFHHNIAGIYRRVGRLAESEAEFRRAIALKPDYGESYQGLAEMVRFEKSDPLLAQIETQLKTAKDDSLRCFCHFAAGKIYDDIGQYSAAFRHYQYGNQAANRSFNNAAFRQQVKDTIYLFSSAFVKRHANSGVPSRQPIFILGMPRSGTSLVEQILASHSSVFGAGEINDLKHVVIAAGSAGKSRFPANLSGLPTAGFAEMGTRYLRALAKLIESEPSQRVVDKHPLNFQFVGPILQMLPNAKIIHTVRHPLDTCLSCFFQNFTRGQDYSFNLESLGHFYNDYSRLMDHWDTLYPGRILKLDYEALLADQETEIRKLLDYCELDLEASCFSFYENDRAVKTASFLQVRKPLYQTSVNRWRNYPEQLAGLAALIGVKIDSPVTISASSSIL